MFTTPQRPYARSTSPSRLRFLVPEDDELGAGGGAGGGEPKAGNGEPEPKFPANTPVKDMTPEQQSAFHENKARKLEDKLKSFNGLTPEQVTQLQKDLEAERAKSQTAEEKALEEAKEQGRSEVRSVLAAERVKNAFTAALAGRVPDAGALLDLDRAKFAKGDQADLDAIKDWVEKNSTEASDATKRRPVSLGQGQRDHVKATDREAGKAAAERRFGKTK